MDETKKDETMTYATPEEVNFILRYRAASPKQKEMVRKLLNIEEYGDSLVDKIMQGFFRALDEAEESKKEE